MDDELKKLRKIEQDNSERLDDVEDDISSILTQLENMREELNRLKNAKVTLKLELEEGE